MPNVRTQCREAYTPRTLSKAILKALVEALVDFKPGLPTAYGRVDSFQNVLLALAVAGFAVWLTGRRTIYLYASLALFVAGVMPALTRSYHFFSPPRKTPIFQETVAKARNFPWAEATAVLAFFTGLLQLATALVAILW